MENQTKYVGLDLISY